MKKIKATKKINKQNMSDVLEGICMLTFQVALKTTKGMKEHPMDSIQRAFNIVEHGLAQGLSPDDVLDNSLEVGKLLEKEIGNNQLH